MPPHPPDAPLVIVTDTTPISELAEVGHLELLRDVYTRALVPVEVYDEVTTGAHPALEAVRSATLPTPGRASRRSASARTASNGMPDPGIGTPPICSWSVDSGSPVHFARPSSNLWSSSPTSRSGPCWRRRC